MKNRGVLVLLGALVVLGGYLAWDLRSEKTAVEEKRQSLLIFPYPQDQVNEILIENAKGGRTRLVKTIDGWTLEEPLKDAADSGFTDDFLGKIMNEGYKEVAKEGDGIDWKVYGLDNPIGKLTVKTQTGQGRTLEMSAKQNFEENGIGRIAGENRVLIVPWSWSANVGRTALDFRDKRLLRYRIGSVERVELTNGQGTVVAESKDGKWSLPAHPEWELDQNRARELLSMINETRVADFLTEGSPLKTQLGDYGLTKPAVRLKLKLKDKTWQADMGAVPKGGKGVPGEFASVSDPAFLVRLDEGSLAKYERITADGLRDKRKPFAFNRDAVKRIEFETPMKKSVFVKNGETWALVDGADGVTVDNVRVQDVVEQLKGASAHRYLPAGAAFKPINKIVLKDDKDAAVFSFEWTAPRKEKIDGQDVEIVAGRTSLSPELLTLENATIANLSLQRMTKAPIKPVTPAETAKPEEAATASETPAPPADNEPLKLPPPVDAGTKESP